MKFHVKYTGPTQPDEIQDFGIVEANTPDEAKDMIAMSVYPRKRFFSQQTEDDRQAFKDLLEAKRVP